MPSFCNCFEVWCGQQSSGNKSTLTHGMGPQKNGVVLSVLHLLRWFGHPTCYDSEAPETRFSKQLVNLIPNSKSHDALDVLCVQLIQVVFKKEILRMASF